jgi:hypothetical protein
MGNILRKAPTEQRGGGICNGYVTVNVPRGAVCNRLQSRFSILMGD